MLVCLCKLCACGCDYCVIALWCLWLLAGFSLLDGGVCCCFCGLLLWVLIDGFGLVLNCLW